MAYITRNSPEYAQAAWESDSGSHNNFDQYLGQTPMTESYWRGLGYTGPMDEAAIQQWMAGQGLSMGYDSENAQNALMGASGPVAGSTYSVDDTGDFMRDAFLTAAGGYFGGNALAGAMAPAAGGLQGAIAQGALTGGAAGSGIGALGTAGQLGAGLGAVGAATAGGDPTRAAMYGNEGYGAGMTGGETSAFDAGMKTAGGGGNVMGNKAGTSLADFFTGNGSLSDYMRAGSTLYGMYANDRATDAAVGGQNDANALMRQMYEQNRADNQPLLDMRNSTLPQIQNLLANPSSITSDPGYQFGLKQGQSQIDNQAAARGGYYSGAQMKASQRYGQDYASTKLNDSLNRLMGVAGLGQVGATANQSNNTNYSQMGGNGFVQNGNNRGSGYIGGANTLLNGANAWMQDNYWQQALKGGGG